MVNPTPNSDRVTYLVLTYDDPFSRYGAKYFLGVGMLINSVFGLLVPVSAKIDFWALIAVRFVQGLGEVISLQNYSRTAILLPGRTSF